MPENFYKIVSIKLHLKFTVPFLVRQTHQFTNSLTSLSSLTPYPSISLSLIPLYLPHSQSSHSLSLFHSLLLLSLSISLTVSLYLSLSVLPSFISNSPLQIISILFTIEAFISLSCFFSLGWTFSLFDTFARKMAHHRKILTLYTNLYIQEVFLFLIDTTGDDFITIISVVTLVTW